MYIREQNEETKEMGYALFAQRKLVLEGQLNCLQLQQTQRSNEQYALATETLGLQQQMSSIQAAQSTELASEYEKLAQASSESARDAINANIKAMEEDFQAELDAINRKIYQTSVKENTIEMAVKRLDTEVTAVEKQLEAVEEAEGDGIDKATPKFNGIS